MQEKEKIKHITFVGIPFKNMVLFKKYQFELSQELGKNISNKKIVFLLIQKTKEILEKENKYIPVPQEGNFIERFTRIKRKNSRKISANKNLQIEASEPERELFYNVSYSIEKLSDNEELSYTDVFNKLLEINGIYE